MPMFCRNFIKNGIHNLLRSIKKKELIHQAKKTLRKRENYNQQFADLSQKIQAQLSVAREESQFLAEINNVANQNYVHIETMNPRPFKDLGDFKEISVEIKMEANLGNLVRFLHQMRESSVLLETSRLRLQPKSERSALLKGHLIISTLYLKKNDT